MEREGSSRFAQEVAAVYFLVVVVVVGGKAIPVSHERPVAKCVEVVVVFVVVQ